MSCPEEDLDQGGRFLLRRERFIKIFIKHLFEKIPKRSCRNRNRHPWSKSSSGPLIHTPRIPKKVSGKLVRKSSRPTSVYFPIENSFLYFIDSPGKMGKLR